MLARLPESRMTTGEFAESESDVEIQVEQFL